jgi:hypothetical protein
MSLSRKGVVRPSFVSSCIKVSCVLVTPPGQLCHVIFVWKLLELIHTHLGFIFPKIFPCLLVIISHYPVSYISGENIPSREYSLSVDTSV